MGAQLRVVLDQLTHIVDADQADAAIALTRGLVATAPRGCAVHAIVPAGSKVDIAGVDEVRTMPLARRELLTSWQLGIAPGVGGGLIHAPTFVAPLVRHDRVNDHDQTAVTLWDLRAWEAPELLGRSAVAAQKAMLRRAIKHADAVVVPSHAFAQKLSELAKFGGRIRVISGAAPLGFARVDDATERRQALNLPERYVVVAGSEASIAVGFAAAAASDIDVVVLDVPEGDEPRFADLAAAAGLSELRAHMRGTLAARDRAAVLGEAEAFIATDSTTAWPWRTIEALTVGIPVVAVDSGVHRDAIADGGLIVDADDLPDALATALGAAASRLKVLAGDRSRAFSWQSSAERVWALHADL